MDYFWSNSDAALIVRKSDEECSSSVAVAQDADQGPKTCSADIYNLNGRVVHFFSIPAEAQSGGCPVLNSL
jgi:hypothetical protein